MRKLELLAVVGCASAVVLANSTSSAAAATSTARPAITWIDATPTSLASSGGTVLVRVVVARAVRCAFDAARGSGAPFARLTTVSCASGRATITAHVAPNRSSRLVSLRFRVTAKDSRGRTATARVVATQEPAAKPPTSGPTPAPSLVITTTSVPAGTVAASYAGVLAATGGSAPYAWSLLSGSLPPGLTLATGGQIAGTPSSAGSWSFAAQVKDASGAVASGQFVITIAAQAAPPAAPTLFSDNWSGYVLGGGPYTTVRGTFNAPTIYQSSSDSVTSEWVGIDGVSGPSLIQAGVTQQYSAASNSYLTYAWVEELPAPETLIPLPVSPGNQVTVTISQVAGSNWNIGLKNDSTGATYSVNESYGGPAASAEWIVEAPTLAATQAIETIGDFTPVTFTQLGVSPSAGSFSRWVLVQGGVPVSTPSALTPTGFTVAYGSTVPTAP